MAEGKVVQVIGTVVDVEFPPAKLPAILNAIEITSDSGKFVLEVQEHMGNNRVRCLSLSPTEGLSRGVTAVDTGAPISVPVGRAALGRLFNVMGEPLDGLGVPNQLECSKEAKQTEHSHCPQVQGRANIEGCNRDQVYQAVEAEDET